MEDKIEHHILLSLHIRSECERMAKTYSKTAQEDLMQLIEENTNEINQCEAEVGNF